MKNSILKYSIFLLLLSSCRIIYPDIKYEPIKFGSYYFPTYDEVQFEEKQKESGEINPWIYTGPNDSLSEFTNQWYSKHLNSLGEPILYTKTNKQKKIIRFTHLGTWSNPYSYRLEKKDKVIKITYNKTKGLGGYKAGRRIKHKTKKVALEKWEEIIEKVENIDFWSIETHDPNMVLDGEEWILEILIDDRYHFISRNSPDVYDGKEYAELCTLIANSFSE
ncbi:hypothetical protein [Aequorivita xiaoshiensis]|uniref:Uncharacterized protein n=1 Tax=Aequorivita xiaoshiensis TaxID=2874476 RepID=A0A9X1U3P8_9FLAO|nr:hypothetical protein [Aequorivita xiaoshiensis]MCG2431024.1 hypothetical protein [Aequorivita xiaoshiensis]